MKFLQCIMTVVIFLLLLTACSSQVQSNAHSMKVTEQQLERAVDKTAKTHFPLQYSGDARIIGPYRGYCVKQHCCSKVAFTYYHHNKVTHYEGLYCNNAKGQWQQLALLKQLNMKHKS